MYKDDLPSPELIHQELRRWKFKWEGKSPQAQPSSCAHAIKGCDVQQFPNISQLLKMACTLPVASCECERLASMLRRLNTFMWASVGEERLLLWLWYILTMTWLYRSGESCWHFCIPIYIQGSWSSKQQQPKGPKNARKSYCFSRGSCPYIPYMDKHAFCHVYLHCIYI